MPQGERLGTSANERLAVRHQILEAGASSIPLEHGELGLMAPSLFPGPKAPTYLEYIAMARGHETLHLELWRSHEEPISTGFQVYVSLRSRKGNSTRSLHFQETLVAKMEPQGVHDLSPKLQVQQNPTQSLCVCVFVHVHMPRDLACAVLSILLHC
jgi:hypothetical protein